MGRFTTVGSAIFLSIGGPLFGYDSGIISSTIAQPHFVEYMDTPSAAERGGESRLSRAVSLSERYQHPSLLILSVANEVQSLVQLSLSSEQSCKVAPFISA